MVNAITSLEQWRKLVQHFEACTLPKAQWTHRAHLVVGLWYVVHESPTTALNTLRTRICAYNVATGGVNSDSAGYHETLTQLYWIGIRNFLQSQRGDAASQTITDLEVLSRLLQSPMADKAWPLSFYSRELLMSVKLDANGSTVI